MPEPARRPEASGPGIPNINPVTGLSTDYLNHFTEVLMALEMVADIPECADGLRAWQPRTYTEHFAQSRFSNRATVIRLYEAADPALRLKVDETSAALNRMLAAARDAALRHQPEAEPAQKPAAARPLIEELAALINGTADEPGERHDSQAAIDAMFAR